MSNELYIKKQLPLIVEVFDLNNPNPTNNARFELITNQIEVTQEFVCQKGREDIAYGMLVSYQKFHLN